MNTLFEAVALILIIFAFATTVSPKGCSVTVNDKVYSISVGKIK